MTNPIQRYKIGYTTDDRGMRSSTPRGIPDHAGAWVRYEDHVAALVEAQQPACDTARYCQSVQRCTAKDESRAQQPAPSAAAMGDVDLPDAEDMAHSAVQEALSFGLSHDVIHRWMRHIQDQTVKAMLAAPQPSPTPQADSQPAPVRDESAARDECKRRWLAEDEDCNLLEAYDRGWKDRAARTPADSVLEDAVRLERERICAAIKAEDDYCVDHGDYMLDSDDCIKIVRGEWVRPDFAIDAASKQASKQASKEQTMTEPTELLPCPFCGGAPNTIERPDNIDGTQFFYAIACYCGRHSACAHKMAVRKTPEIAKADAIAAWNTRTPQAGAVPLTNARLQDISLNYSDSEDECTGFRDGWREAEKHYGIKGGQHGPA